MDLFDFNELFIFEMANNHQGDINHGINIINEMSKISKKFNINGSIKFQFRNLDTFIHPDFIHDTERPHIKRFVETKLSPNEFKVLVDSVQKSGLTAIATAFDEESVYTILDLGIQVIKIASCSALDHPLLEKVASTGLPVIISTAGLNINQIDRIVSFFQLKRVKFALMHCVAIYPTPAEKLRLGQIKLLTERYPNVTIGYSTHEVPDNYSAIQIAYTNGARIFEKHVAIKNSKYEINKYSATPDQVEKWIQSYQNAKIMIGGGDERPPAFPEEIQSLESLKRGVYVKKAIKKGELICRDDVFFAMPLQADQLKSEKWSDSGFKADRNYSKNSQLDKSLSPFDYENGENLIFQIILQTKAMLNNALISFGKESSIEISHHFGLEKFRSFGAVIVDVVNKEYCKKIIVQFPRQKHPYHYHKKKEETFQLLYGDLQIFLDGKKTDLRVGDIFHVPQNSWHKFQSSNGAVFEEISTRHFNDDSYYEDERIVDIPREKRKTKIPNWEAAIIDKI